jgi:hypothetical protein
MHRNEGHPPTKSPTANPGSSADIIGLIGTSYSGQIDFVKASTGHL